MSLISCLDSVYAETISMDDKVTKKAKQLVEQVVIKSFINEMKEVDTLFQSIFQRVFFAGSFYDGLRVGEATEFDLNIVLNLPFSYHMDFQYYEHHSDIGKYFNVVPSYAVLCSEKEFSLLMPRNHPRYNGYRKLGQFFESKCYSGYIFRKYCYVFLPGKVRAWFESVVIKAKNRILSENTSWFGRKMYGNWFDIGVGSIQIDVVKSGPAHTLQITTKDGFKIDVDLVPVIQFDDTFLVPKPHDGDMGKIWRLSYPLLERSIVHGQSSAKKVIKLLKRFRDMQGAPWKKLSSYYLKTLVMLSNDEKSWGECEYDQFFISCLQELLECLTKRYLPFYFDKKHNLFRDLNNATIDNMQGRLKRILRDIETNCVSHPETIRKYFVKEECNTESLDGSYSSCNIM